MQYFKKNHVGRPRKLLELWSVEHFYKEALKENKNTTWLSKSAKKTLDLIAKRDQVLDLLQALVHQIDGASEPGRRHHRRGQTTWRGATRARRVGAEAGREQLPYSC
jgi:hypothetical protein